MVGVGVLKVERIDVKMNLREIRKVFREHDARPSDIHLVLDANNKRTGSAFLSYDNEEGRRNGLNVDGFMYNNKRIIVRESNPPEFNRYFPGKNLFSVPPGRGKEVNNSPGRFPQNVPRNQNREMDNQERKFPERTVMKGRGIFRKERGRPGQNVSRPGPNNSFESRKGHSNEFRSRRDRSRSPIDKTQDRDVREAFLKNFTKQDRVAQRREEKRREEENKALPPPYHNPLENLNEKKFVRIAGFPYDASEVEIQKFFRPVLSRDVFYLSHTSGKFAGKPNGCAIVEFFSESDAKQSLKLDGKRFGMKQAYLTRPEKDEIIRAVKARVGNAAVMKSEDSPQLSSSVPDLSNLSNLANNNPQVAHLISLLTETVNAIAGTASLNQSSESRGKESKRSYDGHRHRGSRQGGDPLVNRVANSANIDVNDISKGRVVGIRNLPYSVTPGEILQFFQGYHAVRDSVRIHYLNNGRCSGDAIITFRGKDDARAAVARLNKRKIAGRTVELFFL